MNKLLISSLLLISLIGCEVTEKWDLLIHTGSSTVIDTFTLEGFSSKAACEAAGEAKFEGFIQLCVKQEGFFSELL